MTFLTIGVLSLLATTNLNAQEKYPECTSTNNEDPCFAFWVMEDGTALQGLVANNLLHGFGMALAPDGVFYIGEYKHGRRHGLGIWSTQSVSGWEGFWSIGYQRNDIRYGVNLYVWDGGRFWLGNDTGAASRKTTVSVEHFSQWQRAFTQRSLADRKMVQYALSQSYLKKDLPLYNGAIDGVWGPKTFTALAAYAALKGRYYFRLQNYAAARVTIESVLQNDFVNFPFGFTVSPAGKNADQNATLASCPSNPTLVEFRCFGSYRFESGEVYNGTWENGVQDGEGRTTFPNGVYIDGTFSNGELKGEVEIYEADGTLMFSGPWQEFLASIEEDSATPADKHETIERQAVTGSGFLVSSKGHIITNNHVIDGCGDVVGEVAGVTYHLNVVAKDKHNDLAILTGEIPGGKGLPVSRENAKTLDDVIVAGFPFGKSVSTVPKFTKGVVSALSGIGDNFSFLQIDAALQPGNSGGPVLSDTGEVIGVAVYKFDHNYALENFGALPENMNFAVKSSTLLSMLDAHNVPYLTASTWRHINARTIAKSLVHVQCEPN